MVFLSKKPFNTKVVGFIFKKDFGGKILRQNGNGNNHWVFSVRTFREIGNNILFTIYFNAGRGRQKECKKVSSKTTKKRDT